MSYRSSKGTYRTRNSNNANTNDSNYTSAAYSTQAGFQTQQQTTPQTTQKQASAGFKQAQTVTAVKPEYDTQMKSQPEYQVNANQAAKTTAGQQPADGTPMQQDTEEKPWKKRSFPKLPKKIKKKRMNAKLRHLLAPKNAMMVLHELHPGLVCIHNEETGPTGQMCYTVIIDINGKQYKGQGLSKAIAKQSACESALKAALFEKMAQSAVAVKQESDGTATSTTPAAAANTTSAMDTSEAEAANGETTTKSKKPPEEDDVPWGSLASYALFKLFSEWQAQGYTIPNASAGKMMALKAQSNQGFKQWGYSDVGTIGETAGQMPMKKIPEDASSRHPVQLLNQLKPLCQFVENREGLPPNIVFSFTVTFDGQTFTACAPTKKEAKKLCAKNALISLGIQYND